MRDLVWLVAHWDDVVSDMSVFHRVDDVRTLPLPRLFAMADRLGAYQGAVHAAIALEARQAADGPKRVPASTSTPGAPAAAQPVPEVTSLAEVKRLRAAARLKRFPPDKFGEHKMVDLDDLMAEVNGGG